MAPSCCSRISSKANIMSSHCQRKLCHMALFNSSNSKKHSPQAEETTMGTMSQARKNAHSTKKSNLLKKPLPVTSISSNLTCKKGIIAKEVYICIRHSSCMCADQTGKFLYTERSCNQHLIIAYVVDPNLILAVAFKNKSK